MQHEQPQKIKLICRMKDGKYNCQMPADETALAVESLETADMFLNYFRPEQMLEQLRAEYGEDAVLVFRTDEQQMQEFADFLREHDAVKQM